MSHLKIKYKKYTGGAWAGRDQNKAGFPYLLNETRPDSIELYMMHSWKCLLERYSINFIGGSFEWLWMCRLWSIKLYNPCCNNIFLIIGKTCFTTQVTKYSFTNLPKTFNCSLWECTRDVACSTITNKLCNFITFNVSKDNMPSQDQDTGYFKI